VTTALHLISFDIPYPPNYGGVVDIYFKLKALHQNGVKVHLHCFEYGRERSQKLNQICESVHYYRRDENKLNFLKKEPYVVASRANRTLLEELKKDKLPVLIEGLHNCWLIEQLENQDRKIFVRTHNVEHDYYLGLAEVEKNIPKRQYYKWEASKLAKFEQVLAKADQLLTISQNDCTYFDAKYNNAILLPAFHSSTDVTSKEGLGNFALYHGNMAVGENIEAAKFLIETVFANTNHRLVIAGSNVTNDVKQLAAKYPNIETKSNVSVDTLENLIATAHVNVLPTFQPTGIKLKLLSALFKGRFCIANTEMISNTGLEETCILANNPVEWKKELDSIFNVAFNAEEIEKRKKVLEASFSNTINAQIITNLLREKVSSNV